MRLGKAHPPLDRSNLQAGLNLVGAVAAAKFLSTLAVFKRQRAKVAMITRAKYASRAASTAWRGKRAFTRSRGPVYLVGLKFHRVLARSCFCWR